MGLKMSHGSKFELEKHHTPLRSLSTIQKYLSPLPVKKSKVKNVNKLVKRYIPQEHHHFYDSIKGNDNMSSETDESDEN